MLDRRAKLKELIVDRMNLDIEPSAIGDEDILFGEGENSLGLDSIDALDLVVGIYEEFDVEIDESSMHVFKNVATLDEFIQQTTLASAEA